jgi:hypothetical protein
VSFRRQIFRLCSPTVTDFKTKKENPAEVRICDFNYEDIGGYKKIPSAPIPQLEIDMESMVHKVSLNDPSVTALDFSNRSMPLGNPRILPKLFEALATNTHLLKLSLACSGIQGRALANTLASSLSQNSTLQSLNLDRNSLMPSDLEVIFQSLADNTALQVLLCSDQCCDCSDCKHCFPTHCELASAFQEEDTACPWHTKQVTTQLLRIVNDVLQDNRTLEKVGINLSERHFRDQITKALIKNTELRRQRRGRSVSCCRSVDADEFRRATPGGA